MSTDVFAVVSDPTRRRILRAVRDGERPVNDIVAELGVSQPTVSKHLRVLREVGLVRMQAHGQRRLYRLEAEPLEQIVEWVRHLSHAAPEEAQDAPETDSAGDVQAEPAASPDAKDAAAAPSEASAEGTVPGPTTASPAAPEGTAAEGTAADVDGADKSLRPAPLRPEPRHSEPLRSEPMGSDPLGSEPLLPAPVRHRPRRGSEVVFQPLVLSDGADAAPKEAPPTPVLTDRRAEAAGPQAPRGKEPGTESDVLETTSAEKSAPGSRDPEGSVSEHPEPGPTEKLPEQPVRTEDAGAPETLDPLVVRPVDDEDPRGDHRQPRFLASLFNRRRGRP